MVTPTPKPDIRALVVDDETISRKMIAFALQQEGFGCDSARDGVEASELLAVNSYDVVVTDLQMPRKNGFDLVRELLAREPTPLIIVHTSVIEPKVARELIAEGVDDIVFKPVDYAAFASKIRALFARRQTQRHFGGAAKQNPPRTQLASESSQPPTGTARRELNEVLENFGLAEPVDQVEHYRVGRLLGAGAMGEVYEAEHKLLNRHCAIKFIRPSFLSDVSARDRFTREVRSAAKLSHWNNVSIFDFGVTRDGSFYYVMERLQGWTLQDLVAKNGPLPPSRALQFLAQTCEGLEEAHRLGLIHRDLKPANLMATQSETRSDVLKILDFGLVLDTVTDPLAATVLIHESTLCGSPAFMAPEQIRDAASIDLRADIYALGATAYFLVTGHPPFDAASPISVVCSHLNEDVVPPSELNPDIPSDMNDVIVKCLQKDPDQRFQSTRALANALCACDAFGCWTETDATRWWAQTAQATEKPSTCVESVITNVTE